MSVVKISGPTCRHECWPVTGGNGGLGRAIALGLRDAGATVAVTGRDQHKNEEIATELGLPGAVLTGDVREEGAAAAAVGHVVDRFGRVDILVNNAGTCIGGSVLDLAAEQWQAVIDTHLTGSFLFAKHAARHMVRQGEGGKIVNIGSMYSLYGPPSSVAYASAKTGLLGLTRALAVELAAHDIQVNAILPGWYETELTRGGRETDWASASGPRHPPADGATLTTSPAPPCSWHPAPPTS